ncbi:pilin [Patescibacteria group bacterium]|nr:pilin [Patescibacteria group bacterium]
MKDLNCLDPEGRGISISNCFGFGKFTSLGEVISEIVPIMFSVAGAAMVLYFLFGAFKYLQSRGNKEEVAAAQNIIIHAVIGFIILMFAFLVLQFLLSSLFNIKEGFKIIG